MKRVKWQREGFGELKVINIISLGILITLNILSIVFEGRYNLSPILITSVLLLIFVVSIVLSPKNILPFMYLIIGLCMVFDSSNISDFSASIFFIFSFHVLKNKFYGIGVLVLSLILVTIKSLVVNDTLSGIVIMIIAYAYIYTTYYFLIYKQPKSKPKTLRIDTLGLKEKEKAMIKMYVNGYSYDQISEYLGLNITSSTVRRNIWEIKKNSKTNNDAHFGKWLHDVV